MVQHIVMWTLKEGVDKAAALAHLQTVFAEVQKQVPGMLQVSVHGGYQGYDLCLMSRHESREALAEYRVHPAHLAAQKIVGGYRAERASCDFEIE